MISLLVMTDGREDYLARSLASVDRLRGPITELWMHDDTGDEQYRDRLAATYPQYTQLGAGPRRGFGGAIDHAWRQLSARSTADLVFHLEGDFVINRTTDLGAMAQLLVVDPTIVQVALRRQAWGSHEHACGGVVEMHPDAYTDETFEGHPWLRHRLFFTTNPCLYRRSLCGLGWPTCERSEGMFTARLLRDGTPEQRGDTVGFAYWGARGYAGTVQDGPWVEHIGAVRAGTGY